MPEKNEENMALLMQRSDPQALSKLYDRYAPLLLGVITRIVGEKKMAEDILQLCFIEIWENKKTYDALKERLFTWMCKIARRSAMEFIKAVDSDKTNEVNNYVNAGGSQNNNVVNLQEDESAALDLVFLQGYTLDEAAQKLNLTADTLKQLVIAGTKRLKEIAVA